MKLFRAGSCVCTGQDWLQILERLAAFVALWNLIGVVIVRQVGGLGQELASTIIELALEECVLEIAYGGSVAQLAQRRVGSSHPMQPLLGTYQVEE